MRNASPSTNPSATVETRLASAVSLFIKRNWPLSAEFDRYAPGLVAKDGVSKSRVHRRLTLTGSGIAASVSFEYTWDALSNEPSGVTRLGGHFTIGVTEAVIKTFTSRLNTANTKAAKPTEEGSK